MKRTSLGSSPVNPHALQSKHGTTPTTTKQTRLRESKRWATRSMLVRLGTACGAVEHWTFGALGLAAQKQLIGTRAAGLCMGSSQSEKPFTDAPSKALRTTQTPTEVQLRPRSPFPWHRSSMHPGLCSWHMRSSTRWDVGGAPTRAGRNRNSHMQLLARIILSSACTLSRIIKTSSTLSQQIMQHIFRVELSSRNLVSQCVDPKSLQHARLRKLHQRQRQQLHGHSR